MNQTQTETRTSVWVDLGGAALVALHVAALAVGGWMGLLLLLPH